MPQTLCVVCLSCVLVASWKPFMACWLGRQHVQAANVYSGSFLVDLHVVNTLYIRMNVHLHSGCATNSLKLFRFATQVQCS